MDITKGSRTARVVLITVIVLTSGCFKTRSNRQSDGRPDGDVSTENTDGTVSSAGSDRSGEGGSGGRSGGYDAADSSGGAKSDATADSPNGYTFSGRLRSNVDESPVPGCVVKALDNTTLAELGVQPTPAADGSFTLGGLPDGEVCLLAVGTTGQYEQIDTFTHNVVTDQQHRDIYSMPLMIAEMIDDWICGDLRTDLGNVSGSVRYLTEDGEDFGVGCATVEVENATEDTIVYYFTGGLPLLGYPRNPPCDETGAGRTMETGSDGRFLAANLPPGPVRLNAMVDGQVIGSTTLTIRAPEESTGGQYNHNITRIFADNIGNPTPFCNYD